MALCFLRFCYFTCVIVDYCVSALFLSWHIMFKFATLLFCDMHNHTYCCQTAWLCNHFNLIFYYGAFPTGHEFTDVSKRTETFWLHCSSIFTPWDRYFRLRIHMTDLLQALKREFELHLQLQRTFCEVAYFLVEQGGKQSAQINSSQDKVLTI